MLGVSLTSQSELFEMAVAVMCRNSARLTFSQVLPSHLTAHQTHGVFCSDCAALFFFTTEVNGTFAALINEAGSQDLHCNCVFQI